MVLVTLFLATFVTVRYAFIYIHHNLIRDSPWFLWAAIACAVRFRIVDWIYTKYWFDEGVRTRRATARRRPPRPPRSG